MVRVRVRVKETTRIEYTKIFSVLFVGDSVNIWVIPSYVVVLEWVRYKFIEK